MTATTRTGTTTGSSVVISDRHSHTNPTPVSIDVTLNITESVLPTVCTCGSGTGDILEGNSISVGVEYVQLG